MNYRRLLGIYNLPVSAFAYTQEGEDSADHSQGNGAGEQFPNLLGLNADMFNNIIEDDDSCSGIDGWVEEEEFKY